MFLEDLIDPLATHRAGVRQAAICHQKMNTSNSIHPKAGIHVIPEVGKSCSERRRSFSDWVAETSS
jgi:hypothetical protein